MINELQHIIEPRIVDGLVSIDSLTGNPMSDSVDVIMDYPRRIIEAYLSSWELEESGQTGDQPLSLVGELVYPRPMIDRREHTLAIPHKLGEPVDWSEKPFHQKIMFKEVVEGPFTLGFTIVRNTESGTLERLLRSAVESTAGLAKQEARSRLVLPPLAEVVSTAVDLGFESLLNNELNDVVATGFLELSSADVHEDEVRTAELMAPVDIPNPRPDPQPERHTEYRETLKQAGEPNGVVDVRLRIMDR